MRATLRSGLLVVLACSLVLPVQAQSNEELLQQGRRAYLEGRFDEAVRVLERAAENAQPSAEAHYLLARLYNEDTPLHDERRAGKEIDQALKIEPGNVRYMVAKLEHLRRAAPNFIVERLRDIKRRELSRRILAVDSTNAYAHEELGVTYIRDYWRYRNAVALPYLSFSAPDHRRTLRPERVGADNWYPGLQENPGEEKPGSQPNQPTPELASTADLSFANLDPLPSQFNSDDIFVTDRFDLAQMKQQGVMVQDLSARATYAYEQAIGHLQRALASDPRRRSVYDHLMRIYVLKEAPEQALNVLEEMFVQFPEDPELWLYLGYANYRTHRLDAAAKSFEKALTLLPADTRHAYESLDYFLSGEEKEAYLGDSVRYSTRYWTSKDPRFLTAYNERKLEHYARLVYADLLYGAEDLDLRGWETERGRILVRYGVPNVDVVLFANSTAGKELKMPGTSAYETFGPESMRSEMDEGNTFNIWDYGDFRFVFEDPLRSGEYQLYSPSASEIAAGTSMPWENDYVLKAQETFRKVPERYAYESPGRAVQLPYLVSAFKGPAGKTALYVHYGVPIAGEAQAGETIEVTANVGAFLVGENRDMLAERRRRLYGLRADQIVRFEETALWTDTQAMEAPPGTHELSMEFETASGNIVGVQRRAVKVPAFEGEKLALSDVMLAYHVEPAPDGKPLGSGDIVRQGLSIRPAPWSVFGSVQPIYLYFEAYGLRPGDAGQTDYEVEARLVPKDQSSGVARFFKNLFGGGEEGVAVRFDATGTRADEEQYLILEPKDREPGLYTLTVRVRDRVAGKTTESTRDLFLE